MCSDLLQNPLIVPVKQLSASSRVDGLGEVMCMYVCVYVCVCMYVFCMYVCMYVYVYVCMLCMYVYVCMMVCLFVVGVLWCEFHPSQPWLISAGADATIRLFAP